MKLNEAEIKKNCLQFISDSAEHSYTANLKEKAKGYQDYFRGGKHQWTENEWNAYESKGITPITINRCKPVIKGVLGMYLESKQDVRVRPRRSGSSTVAQVYTEILKHTQDVSYADYVYSQVFLRGLIDTESFLKLRIDKTMNINGQPIIEGKSILDISIDRNAIEYDLNESAKYIIEKDWKDRDEIDAMYPENEQQIKEQIESIDETGSSADRIITYMTSGEVDNEGDSDESDRVSDHNLMQRYRYLLHRVHWKESIPILIVHDRQNMTTTIVEDEKKVIKLSRKGKKSKRFEIINHVKKVLHETLFLRGLMMEDIVEPLGKGVNEYPIVRFSPMFDEGYTIGALDDIISLNKEENIHRTQTTRLLNQTANGGWIVNKLMDPTFTKLLKNFGSVPGIVLPKDKFGGSIEKIKPNQLSVGHVTLGQQYEQDIKRVSNVDDATQGYTTGQTESGRAINLKMNNNRTTNDVFFDSFYRTLEIFGNVLLKALVANQFYTDDEIRLIVEESTLIDPELLAKAQAKFVSTVGAELPEPQPLPEFNPQLMAAVRPEDQGEILQTVQAGAEGAQLYLKRYPQLKKNWDDMIKAEAIEMLLEELHNDKGLYGIKVTVSPSAPTERLSQLMQMEAIMKNYANLIPPDVFIDLTDLPQKEAIKARIQQNMQAQGQQARGAA